MNPVLLALLCKLIGYLDGQDHMDLEEYMQPIEELVNKEIELLNHPEPMPDEIPEHIKMMADRIENCLHFGEKVDHCLCNDDCPCKFDSCQPRPLVQLPQGINLNGDGTASGMNLSNQIDEQYYHCVQCGGWHKGDPNRQREADGVALLCLYCHNIVARAETRNEDPS